MPGIDSDLDVALDALPTRLARLLLTATDAVERKAAEGGAPEATARTVGVIARAGAALVAFRNGLARRRPGETEETEEAAMDDAETPWESDVRDGADLERCLRNLSRNLRLGAADDGGVEHDGRPAAGGAAEELGCALGRAPVGR